MAIADELMTEMKKYSTYSSDFKAQHEDFKKLKKELLNAGYIYGDKFEVPLMIRMGCKINSKQGLYLTE